MKFEQQLALITIPSWAEYYLDYKGLKHVLYTDAKESSNEFQAQFQREIAKVNKHYCNQETSARAQMDSLRAQWRADMPAADEEAWKSKFTQLLQQLENLADYTQANVTGCRKILKKADKVAGEGSSRTMWPMVTKLRFATSEADEELLREARAAWRKRTAVPATGAPAGPTARRIVPAVPTVTELDLEGFPAGQISRVWVALAEDALGLPIRVPVIVARGAAAGPVVGITAALHGNELNGIPLIHRLIGEVEAATLHGTLVAVPVANAPGFLLSQRGYADGTDLNRVMPGKVDGSSPQVYAYNLMHRITRHFEYHLDLHTASRGRVNSLYVRADLTDPRTARMARLQNPQIIVHNTSPGGSLRGASMQRGIAAITVEVGDPSRFQKRFVKNALLGVTNILSQLRMVPDEQSTPETAPVVCTRSFWIFARSGGILTVHPDVATWVRAGELIASVHSVFGDLEEEYFAPQDGIIVGKHVDPVCQTGNRILHLGVVEDTLPAVVDDGHL
ncbi:hypothetical protein IWW50_000346 [Coemansia erecta]|nr:hypothetical protein GGF43_000465 [Coemansia sp. RSA 2618]KAJ2830313.1 hypothetical protein IWW50_000346 [Coemansia erecta]